MGNLFYSYCPLNNHTMCTDGTSTHFFAQASPKTFKFDKMKRSANQIDACIYTIGVPEHKYQNATIFFRVNTND